MHLERENWCVSSLAGDESQPLVFNKRFRDAEISELEIDQGLNVTSLVGLVIHPSSLARTTS